MRRRDLLAGLPATTTATALRAAEPNKIYQLAFASTVADLSETGTYKPLFAELRRLGYVERQNFVVGRFSTKGDASRYDTIIGDAVSRSSHHQHVACLDGDYFYSMIQTPFHSSAGGSA
jgi:putative ABC transport system substrate-binding protein